MISSPSYLSFLSFSFLFVQVAARIRDMDLSFVDVCVLDSTSRPPRFTFSIVVAFHPVYDGSCFAVHVVRTSGGYELWCMELVSSFLLSSIEEFVFFCFYLTYLTTGR